MHPTNGVEALSRLIDEEHRTLVELERLLGHEHQILVRNEDPAALEDACDARQICMGTLLRVQEERRLLLRALGHAADNAGIAAFLAVSDPTESLRRRWIDCAEVAQRCRDLNERNGALVNARMRRVESMLDLLTGQRVASPLYDRGGSVAEAREPRLVATRA